jgi:hypothetical protein
MLLTSLEKLTLRQAVSHHGSLFVVCCSFAFFFSLLLMIVETLQRRVHVCEWARLCPLNVELQWSMYV